MDGRAAVKGMKLKGGETLEIRALEEVSDIRIQPNGAVETHCVFEDSALLAFDKPPAQAVQPLSRHETNTLLNGVAARWPEVALIGEKGNPLMGGACHRIDTGTSGLVLAGRTQAAFEALRAQFAAQKVEKTYLALVEGRVTAGGTLEGEPEPKA